MRGDYCFLIFSLSGREPAGLARPATSFHLLAQMKGGKAKCLNASDPTELHGWKESSVDAEHLNSISASAILEDLRETRAPRRDGSAR
jgi:hypothetical protein